MLRKEWLAHLDGLVVFRGLLAAEPLRSLHAALAADEDALTGAVAAFEAALCARGTNWTDTLLNTVLEEENLCLRVAAGQDAGPVLEKALADELAAYDVVTATEVGGGIVPIDPAERARREAAGRLACLLAARADCVVQMFCGLPTILKGELPKC